MPLFGGRREEASSDEARIRSFFKEVSHMRFAIGSPELEDLIKWGRQTWREKTELEKTTSGLRNTISRLKDKSDDLQARLERTNSDLQKTLASLRQVQHDHQVLQAQKLQDEENWKIEKQQAEESWRTERQQAEESWTSRINYEVETRESLLESTKQSYDMTISHLRTDIMVNQRDSQIWTDEKLKQWVGDLRLQVQDVAPSFMTVPSRVPARLDPTGCLARTGPDDFPQLVRSAIWTVLDRRFFSSPFGFGALGPEKGQLLGTYRAWRCLFDEAAGQEGKERQGWKASWSMG